MLINPDQLICPNLHLNLKSIDNDCIAGTLSDIELYFGKWHPDIYNEFHLQYGLDFRIWFNSKIICFWLDKPNLFKYLKIIKHRLLHGQYFCVHCDTFGELDISDFIVVYQLKNEIIYKTVQELIENPEVEYSDNTVCKLRHLLTPTLKNITEDVNIKWIKHLYYVESCKYWTNKISTLDVAEWHLLMYEE